MVSSASAQTVTNSGTGNVTQICQPKIEVRTCDSCAKPKIITKVVEKIVEKPVVKEVEKQVFVEKEVVVERVKSRKNHVSLIGGIGPKGNLLESNEGGNTVVRTENGPVLGLQYMRELNSNSDSALHLLLQAQTNRTFTAGIGVSF
jgi:hypothetical protein